MGIKTTQSNLKNAVIAFLVPLSSIIIFFTFLNQHYHNDGSPFWKWCYNHPLLLANALFFLNLLFWLIGTIQSSHWMIDPYWTVIPVLLVHYYASHPLAHEHNVVEVLGFGALGCRITTFAEKTRSGAPGRIGGLLT